MVSAYTPNINLEEPARGDQVGTWDTPVNANMTLIDLVVGGQASILLAGAPVVLAAAQFQARTLVFSSTLTANVAITFPSTFFKSYEVYNQCTGSSAFTITLTTTFAGSNQVCCPPGEVVDIANLGGNMYFKNLGRVGSYWDHAGSSVPNWVSGCTIPPYLACTGVAFSSVTYPNLANFLGSATTPDARGRARYALDAGAGRVSSAGSGVAGNTLLGTGGDQLLHAHTHTNSLTDPGHIHATTPAAPAVITAGGAVTLAAGTNQTTALTINSAVTGVTITNAAQGFGVGQNMPPVYMHGITLIRAG